MPYDAQRKVFLPDFQPNTQLPGWVPGMGDQGGGQDMGAIGSAFKKRLMDGGGGAPDGSLPYEGNGMPVDVNTGMAGAVPVAGAAAKPSGGMMKSLG